MECHQNTYIDTWRNRGFSNFPFLATSAQKLSDALKVTQPLARLPAARELPRTSAQRAGSERELARALKAFYQSMNAARGQFLTLRHYKPPVSNQNPGSKRNLSPFDSGIWGNCIAWAWGGVCAFKRKKQRWGPGVGAWTVCLLLSWEATFALAFLFQ